MVVVLFFRKGIMGDKELPEVLRNLQLRLSGKAPKKLKKAKEADAQ